MAQKIHFVGIGGVSMFSLAIYALNSGKVVSGSDINVNQNIKKIKKMGVVVYNKHSPQNLNNVNLVVYSSATEQTPEVIYAKQNNIKTMSRAQFLSRILKEYITSICVSGAHGKTTTTAMIYEILKMANAKPSLHLGGNLAKTNQSYDYEDKNYIVCEACEYKDSFLKLSPSISVILNMAPEHLDYFKCYDNVKKSFSKFANKSKISIINYEYLNYINIKNKQKVITFGLNKGDFYAKNIICNKNYIYFDCYKKEKFYTKIKLNSPLKHNIINALASICVCDFFKISKKDIFKGLSNFGGVERRYQSFLSNKNLFHDYAHHPEEISSIISEIKKTTKKKLVVVFQPHTYSRTKTLFHEFLNSFYNADEVVLTKTFSAREKYNYWGSAKYLAKKLNQKYIKTQKEVKDFIIKKLSQNCLVLTLGAGNIYEITKSVDKLLLKQKN